MPRADALAFRCANPWIGYTHSDDLDGTVRIQLSEHGGQTATVHGDRSRGVEDGAQHGPEVIDRPAKPARPIAAASPGASGWAYSNSAR